MNPAKSFSERYILTLVKWTGKYIILETDDLARAIDTLQEWHSDTHNYYKLELYDTYNKSIISNSLKLTLPFSPKKILQQDTNISIIGVSSSVK